MFASQEGAVFGSLPGGDVNGLAAESSWGVRPALILPSNAVFDENTMLLKGVK